MAAAADDAAALPPEANVPAIDIRDAGTGDPYSKLGGTTFELGRYAGTVYTTPAPVVVGAVHAAIFDDAAPQPKAVLLFESIEAVKR